jgi:hypothetical protein
MSAAIKLFFKIRSLFRSLWHSLPLWAFSLCLGASEVLAAGGGKPATKLVNVADTRAMTPGFSRWVADMYNTNLWLYGIIVVVLMASLGLVLGTVFDRILGLLGIHLGKLEHHE